MVVVVAAGAATTSGAAVVAGETSVRISVVGEASVMEVLTIEGLAATTRLGSGTCSVTAALSAALLLDEALTMSITNNGRHASVTIRAINKRRCVGWVVAFRTRSSDRRQVAATTEVTVAARVRSTVAPPGAVR